MVIGRFKKITSLVLSGICVKSKFLWFINILQKLHAWEKSSSEVKDIGMWISMNKRNKAHEQVF